jgi:DNA-binding transcriptional LysR family regulator
VGAGIRLTDAGQLFLRDADVILKRLARLETRLKGLAAAPTQPLILNVGAGNNVSGLLMPSLLIRFRSNHPNIQVNLRSGDKKTLEKFVRSGRVDVAIVTNPTGASEYIIEPFLTRQLVALVLANSPLAQKREISIGELAGHPLVIRGRKEGSKVLRILTSMERHGVKLNIYMYCGSANMLKTAVRETNGIGILYEDVVESDLSNGEFRLFRIPGLRLTAKISLVYRRHRPLSAPARDFLALLRQWRQRS